MILWVGRRAKKRSQIRSLRTTGDGVASESAFADRRLVKTQPDLDERSGK
jgi:hypothetical protein